ncbi:1837_t:CDS:2, partial [Ambispora gerdemannii]
MTPPSPDFEKSFWKFNKLLRHFERAVTSWFTTPLVLLTVRTIFLTYSLITLALSIYVHDRRGRLHSYLTYFTNLGFLGLTAYFAMAVVHSLIFAIYREPKSFAIQPKVLTIAFWILYDAIVVYHILIPLVSWIILVPNYAEESSPHLRLLTFNQISMNGVDFFMMIVEVVLNRMPLVMSHLIFVLAILVFYLFETWISYAISQQFPYQFLDLREQVTGYHFGVIGVAIIGAFLIQKLIHVLRDTMGRRLWRKGLIQEMEAYRYQGNGNRPSVAAGELVDVVVRTPNGTEIGDIENARKQTKFAADAQEFFSLLLFETQLVEDDDNYRLTTEASISSQSK